MIEYIAYALVGILAGSVTGLIPGLHINTIALIALGLFYTYSFDPVNLSIFILSMAITHSFMDFIPSIYLGAPSSDTVLSIQPGHKMLLSGRGFEAVALSVAGGIFGIFFVLILLAVLFCVVPLVYTRIRSFIPFLLIIVQGYMILMEKNKFGALLVCSLSALYGIVLMNTHIISQRYTLFVMLTSLFGISSLILSYATTNKLPHQKPHFKIKLNQTLSGSFVGFVGGLVAGTLPGLGSSQSAILVQKFGRMKSRKKYITSLGTINTIDILISVFSLYMIGKARSGSAIVIQEVLEAITLDNIYLFLGIALFSTGIASLLTLKIGKVSAAHIHKINYKKMVLTIILFLALLTFMYTGFAGLLICATGIAIGVLPNLLGTKKSLLMSCLIAPTILYLTGTDYMVLKMLGL